MSAAKKVPKLPPSAVYLRAAELIDCSAKHTGENDVVSFSCCAVAEAAGIFPKWNVTPNFPSKLVREYRSIFDGEFSFFRTDEGKQERILALLLMSQIALDAERSERRKRKPK